MKYTLTIDAQADLIVVCRLLNVFRRKGLRLLTLGMELTSGKYRLEAVGEMAEPDSEHLYHFLRRTEGVYQVACERQADSEPVAAT